MVPEELKLGEARAVRAAADGLTIGRVLLPLGLGTALSLMGDATLYTVLPTHTADAGITLAGVGIMLGVNRAVRLLSNGPMGLAYDRWPRRRLFLPALFLGALSTAIYAATRGFWPLLVGRLLWGLAWSGIWIGGATIILDAAPAHDRGRWTGMYQTWFFIGSAFGTLGGGVLTDLVGYNATMWIGSALTALGGLVAALLLPETSGLRPEGGQAASRDPSAARITQPRERRQLSDGRGLWLAVTLQGVNRFVISGIASATLGLLVQAWMGTTDIALGVATVTGVLMAGRTLLSIVAAPAAGTLSDRLGSRWGVSAWGVAIGAVGMLLLAWDRPIAIFLGMGAMAAAGGSIQSLATVLTGDLAAPGQRGRAIGLLHTVGDFGSAIGPSVAYALLPWLDLRTIYVLSGCVFLVALMGVIAFIRARRVHSVTLRG